MLRRIALRQMRHISSATRASSSTCTIDRSYLHVNLYSHRHFRATNIEHSCHFKASRRIQYVRSLITTAFDRQQFSFHATTKAKCQLLSSLSVHLYHHQHATLRGCQCWTRGASICSPRDSQRQGRSSAKQIDTAEELTGDRPQGKSIRGACRLQTSWTGSA